MTHPHTTLRNIETLVEMEVKMNYLYIVVLAIVAFITGEIVTFMMLGFILIALNNILDVLKAIHKKIKN